MRRPVVSTISVRLNGVSTDHRGLVVERQPIAVLVDRHGLIALLSKSACVRSGRVIDQPSSTLCRYRCTPAGE